MFKIQTGEPHERVALREACGRLLYNIPTHRVSFLADAWNRDLWFAMAAEGWQVSEAVAMAAYEYGENFPGRNRIRATIQHLNKESGNFNG